MSNDNISTNTLSRRLNSMWSSVSAVFSSDNKERHQRRDSVDFQGFLQQEVDGRDVQRTEEVSGQVEGPGVDIKKTKEREAKAQKIEKLLDENTPLKLSVIKDIVTAENLCLCPDPIKAAFEVNSKLKQLAKDNRENTSFFNSLADKVEDFAVQLVDQIEDREELGHLDDGHVDRYASLFSGMTDDAIVYQQKKFVSHPLLYERLQMRWNLGLSKLKRIQALFYLFLIPLDFLLTPLLLPVIGFAFYRDQKNYSAARKPPPSILDKYLDYFTTPVVIFMKDKLSQLVFIILHVRVCILGSSITPLAEEYLIFVFFCGMVLNECQQSRTSPTKSYFMDMWNYIDVLTLVVYIGIVLCRVVTIARGGDPYHNRLLEIVHSFYGVNTMFLVLRFSSILELSSVVGPLQLAMFRMCGDLFIIVVQFVFVITAFSLAITKNYTAEMSYMTPSNKSSIHYPQVKPYCEQGAFDCFYKTARQLAWSVFGLTDLKEMQSHTRLVSEIVAVLYFLFLILTVFMLINILVALFTSTYDNVKTNAEVEWKFSRAVVENQYRRMHAVVVPFNLLSLPGMYCYFGKKGDARRERANSRQELYEKFYRVRLFPVITARYLDNYGGSFPLSVEERLDWIMKKFKNIPGAIQDTMAQDPAKALGALGSLIKDSTSIVSQLVEGGSQTPGTNNDEAKLISSV